MFRILLFHKIKIVFDQQGPKIETNKLLDDAWSKSTMPITEFDKVS